MDGSEGKSIRHGSSSLPPAQSGAMNNPDVFSFLSQLLVLDVSNSHVIPDKTYPTCSTATWRMKCSDTGSRWWRQAYAGQSRLVKQVAIQSRASTAVARLSAVAVPPPSCFCHLQTPTAAAGLPALLDLVNGIHVDPMCWVFHVDGMLSKTLFRCTMPSGNCQPFRLDGIFYLSMEANSRLPSPALHCDITSKFRCAHSGCFVVHLSTPLYPSRSSTLDPTPGQSTKLLTSTFYSLQI
ncbi:hypothetical protein BC835DRAFT_62468 [Cytidiella melzeri]|nr:hypothetical protein BC835DRAFT_62468 [Cytidiella melzeri]